MERHVLYPLTDRQRHLLDLAAPLAKRFAERAPQHDVDASFPFENFADLPPAIVATAGFDPLRDEGELYAAALRQAGTLTDLRRYGSLLHAFANFHALGGNSALAVAEITSAVKAHLHYQR